jgi:hypothetical protein
MKVLLADFHRFSGKRNRIHERLPRLAALFCEMGYEVTAVFADEKKGGVPAFPWPEEAKIYNMYYVPGEMVVRPSVLLKALKVCIKPISKAAAREQDFRMVKAAKASLLRILRDETPDIVISFDELTSRILLAGIDVDIPVITWLSAHPDALFAKAPYYERHDIEKSACIGTDTAEQAEKAETYLKSEKFSVLPDPEAEKADEKWADILDDVTEAYRLMLEKRGPKPPETPFSFFRNNW